MMPFTDLETSQALDRLARARMQPCKTCNGLGFFVSTASTVDIPATSFCPKCAGLGKVHPYPKGLGDWLKAYRDSVWAGMDGLTWLEALDFCEQVLKYYIGKAPGGGYYAEHPMGDIGSDIGDNLYELPILVAAILEREKVGTA